MRRHRLVQIPVGKQFTFFPGGPVGTVLSIDYTTRKVKYEYNGETLSASTLDRIFVTPVKK